MSELKKLEELLIKGRMSRRQFLGRFSALGLAGAVSPALWKSIAHAATPKRGGTFRIGLRGGSTAESLDPATYGTGVINHFMVGAIGNCLTEVDHKGAVIPELAESWEVSRGADVWTFRLRQGVTFHNGKTLTADDVIASFNHHRGEDTKSAGKPLLKAVTDIRKADDRTVVFELGSGNADFPYVVSEYFFIIFPSKDGRCDWKSGIATGGYKLTKFEPGVRYVGERYADYWKEGRAHFDRVEQVPLSDQAARTTAIMTGEVDCIGAVDLSTLRRCQCTSRPQIRDRPRAACQNPALRLRTGRKRQPDHAGQPVFQRRDEAAQVRSGKGALPPETGWARQPVGEAPRRRRRVSEGHRRRGAVQRVGFQGRHRD
jgi:peptide/nickel transport system substrate-binding protein